MCSRHVYQGCHGGNGSWEQGAGQVPPGARGLETDVRSPEHRVIYKQRPGSSLPEANQRAWLAASAAGEESNELMKPVFSRQKGPCFFFFKRRSPMQGLNS